MSLECTTLYRTSASRSIRNFGQLVGWRGTTSLRENWGFRPLHRRRMRRARDWSARRLQSSPESARGPRSSSAASTTYDGTAAAAQTRSNAHWPWIRRIRLVSSSLVSACYLASRYAERHLQEWPSSRDPLDPIAICDLALHLLHAGRFTRVRTQLAHRCLKMSPRLGVHSRYIGETLLCAGEHRGGAGRGTSRTH